MQWIDKRVGYADLHPWPELGDAPLQEQLLDLEIGRTSLLIEQAIWLARRDAKLRAKSLNALEGMRKVKNHHLISQYLDVTPENLNEAKTAGFSVLKIKMGRDPEGELSFLIDLLKKYDFLVRLDFNGKASFPHLERLYAALPGSQRAKIEFIEDPVPYTYEVWQELAKLWPLAMDNEIKNVDWNAKTLPFKVLVIKPARQDVDSTVALGVKKNLRMVVTSSMDHPVGVAHAVRIAAELKKDYDSLMLDCGCNTLRAYKPTEFSNQMIWQGPFLTSVPGTGIGFDSLLESLSWKSVREPT